MEGMEGMDGMAAMAGTLLVAGVVMFVLGLLVGGLVLKFSVKLLEGFSPGYGKSVLVVFLSGLVGMVIYFLIAVVAGAGAGAGLGGADPNAAAAGAVMASLVAMGVSLLLNLFIVAFFVNLMMKHPDGRAIGFGRACLAALLYLVAMVVLGIIASVLMGIVFAMLGVGAASMMG